MSNFIIAKPKDDGALTTGNQETLMPASNLLDPQPFNVWQTTSSSNVWVDYNLGSALSTDFIAILYHNAAVADTWRIRGATSQANLTASPTYDSGSVLMLDADTPSDFSPKHSIHYLSTPQSLQWWRIDMTIAGSFFRAGRWYVTKAWQPTVNIAYDWGITFIDNSPKVRSRSNSLFPDHREPFRLMEVRLRLQSEDDLYNNIYELERLRGASRDIFASIDPAKTDHLLRQSVYGALTDIRPIINPNFNVYSTRLNIEEML